MTHQRVVLLERRITGGTRFVGESATEMQLFFSNHVAKGPRAS